ncbi:type II secretion system secretin GspD [Dyella sp. A6]|uniref:type II secretion system secretin GspD n=1 Tax=Dyella aluminiiresistens TaxID=3069105 RepID=UPI002E789267|nr:type II secretion system secretin GspD [Dyella sp. A6]
MSRTFMHPFLRVGAIALLVTLAGCATLPQPKDNGNLQREAMAGTELPPPKPLPLNNNNASSGGTAATTEISRGSGRFIRPQPLARPRKEASGKGAVTFNFENQPVQAVVKAILGDLLKKNYTIVPGVQGNISFSTSEPVMASQALPILETLLSWTNNALVQQNGGYVVLPTKDAVAGNLVPGLGAPAPQAGLQAQLFPLHYISATEMQKLLKPFARPDSILLADAARNLLVLSGTPDELQDYARTIRTFDVDWLRGMSVGVFNLQHAGVDDLMPQLEKMFGPKGDTPLAGMLRFIPIKRTNALVVISTQPAYVDEVGAWVRKIDQGGGNQPQLYVYDVRNIKASDLAKYLAEIYTNGAGASGDSGGQVGPGLRSGTLGLGNNARGSASGMGSGAGSFGSATTGGLGGTSGMTGTGSRLGSGGQGGFGGSAGSIGSSFTSASSQDRSYSSPDGSVRISSVDANNQLLVRARPSQWAEIKDAIKKLDNVPLQVQIETRILEVTLSGQFQFGVQWYLQGLTGSTTNSNGTITPGEPYRHRQIALGSGGNTFTGQPFFYSFLNSKMQVAVQAMESSGNTKTLSAPSLVVLNNQTAHIQVGDQIPVNETSLIGLSGTTTTASSVQYMDTGVILNVQPRVNPGGLVYLNVEQQVSTPSAQNAQGNYTISQRAIGTQVAVQSGQTVLLGGLIEQDDGTTNTGVPWLSRIPVFGKLFGSTGDSRKRTELIVLITPKVIRNSADARAITDDYQREFESLAPLRAKPGTTTDKTSVH